MVEAADAPQFSSCRVSATAMPKALCGLKIGTQYEIFVFLLLQTTNVLFVGG